MNGNHLNIVILCTYAFPEGMAPTIRILSYGKGLVQNGDDVHVVVYRPKIRGTKGPVEGDISGVKYIYSLERDPSKSKLYKLFVDRPKAIFNSLQIIKRLNHIHHVDCVLFSFDNPVFLLFFSLSLRFLKIKTGFIGDEYPEPIRRLKNKLPRYYVYLYKVAYRFISFRILMTNALQSFYDSTVCPKPTHILCSILDEKRFDGLQRESVKRPYLCYMGNMMLAKDNVDNIVKAFSMIAAKFPDIDLRLYGTPSVVDEEIVRKLIESLHLQDRVFLMGRVDYAEVPQILRNASILLASQPKTKRAEGGFPTKLAEYMMSHTPIIVTDVGEIGDYVKDRDTVFMVESCNPFAYAEAIEYVLTHENESNMVSNRAYTYALKNFACAGVSAHLHDFMLNHL